MTVPHAQSSSTLRRLSSHRGRCTTTAPRCRTSEWRPAEWQAVTPPCHTRTLVRESGWLARPFSSSLCPCPILWSLGLNIHPRTRKGFLCGQNHESSDITCASISSDLSLVWSINMVILNPWVRGPSRDRWNVSNAFAKKKKKCHVPAPNLKVKGSLSRLESNTVPSGRVPV